MARSLDRATRTLPCGLLALVLGACGEQGTPSRAVTGDAAPRLALPVPADVLSTRSIDPDALSAVVTVNGDTIDGVSRSGEGRTVSLRVPPGEPVRLEVTWLEPFEGETLTLATFVRDLGPIESDTMFTIDPAEYRSDVYDADQDTLSNLEERRTGSDPRDANDPGVVQEVPPIDARIPRIDANLGTPTIDGRRDEGIWDRARFRNVNDEELFIDSLVIDTQDFPPESNTGYRWFAMHDTEWFYLFVVYDEAGAEILREPDQQFVDDDMLNLFFSAGNARTVELDRENDRYVVIPLGAAEGEERPVAFSPFGLTTLPDVDNLQYGICPCPEDAASRWEVRVSLASLGIEVGQPFGFEVHLDQDIDGGRRDARWGWAHPSEAEREEEPERFADYNFESPAYYGTLVLE